jgi:putative flippase GtrA
MKALWHKHKPLAKEFSRSLACGGISTAVDMATLLILKELVACNLVLAVISGFVAGMLTNYWLNVKVVYAHQTVDGHFAALRTFALISLATIFAGTGIIYVMTNALHIPYFWSKLITTGVIFLVNFALRRAFIFIP